MRHYFEEKFLAEVHNEAKERRWTDDPANVLIFPNQSTILSRMDIHS